MKNKITFILMLFSALFNSCEDIVDVNLSEEKFEFYAVEAKITTESNPFVYLYKSQKVNNDNEYIGVSDAKVTVSDDAQPPKSVELIESTEKRGWYTTPEGLDFKGETDKEYTVTLNVGGIELIARDFLAPVEPIDSIQVRPSLRGENRFLGIFTYGNEPPGLGNFYKWDILINDTLLSQSDFLIFASDELVDGNYIYSFEIFTDFHQPSNPEDRKLNLGDTVLVKQTSISEFAYNFYFQLFNQAQTGGLFSVPPANIQSNITASDGKPVLGLFTAHDVSNSNIVFIDAEIENGLRK
jgi:hypothetical protein